MRSDSEFAGFNKLLNKISLEELLAKSNQEHRKNEEDFQALKDGLAQGRCTYCGDALSWFSRDKPCFHWLLNPGGFKKKYFSRLYKGKSFHHLEAYLRWVANCEKPFQNINNLSEEATSSKFIEETIKYKNLEWSFSCSQGDRLGHADKYEGKMPHYHFQMKVDSSVIINYSGFHIPFTKYDEFCFAVKRGEFDRLRSRHIHGAGMQELLDHQTPEEIVNNLRQAKNIDDAQLKVDTFIEADEGTTISGDEIADMLRERDRTGVSMAKLVQKLKNTKTQTIITPGPGVPEIASRKKNRTKRIAYALDDLVIDQSIFDKIISQFFKIGSKLKNFLK